MKVPARGWARQRLAEAACQTWPNPEKAGQLTRCYPGSSVSDQIFYFPSLLPVGYVGITLLICCQSSSQLLPLKPWTKSVEWHLTMQLPRWVDIIITPLIYWHLRSSIGPRLPRRAHPPVLVLARWTHTAKPRHRRHQCSLLLFCHMPWKVLETPKRPTRLVSKSRSGLRPPCHQEFLLVTFLWLPGSCAIHRLTGTFRGSSEALGRHSSDPSSSSTDARKVQREMFFVVDTQID